MKTLIKATGMQLKLMVNKKEFQFVFGINLGYVLLTYLYYAFINWGQEISTIPAPHAVFALQDTSIFYDMYVNIVPFLVVFPYAMSFINDRQNRLLPLLQVRTGVKNYYLSKGIACFLGGFLTFFIPLVLNILLNQLTFPDSGITFIGDLYDINYDARIAGSNIILETDWAGMWFPELFIGSPQGYNLLFAVIFSVAMGIFSVFVYSISFGIKKKIMLLLPLYLIIITGSTLDLLLFDKAPHMSYKVFFYLSVNAICGKNPMYIYLFFLTMVVISYVMLSLQIRKDQLD